MSDTNLATRPHAEHSPSRLAYMAKCPWWKGGEAGANAERGSDLGEQVANAVIHAKPPRDPAAEDAAERVAIIMANYPAMTWKAETHVDTGIPGVKGYVDIEGNDGFGGGVQIELKSGYGDREPPETNLQIGAYNVGLFLADPTLETIDTYLVEIDQRVTHFHSFTRADVLGIKDRIIALLDAASRATPDDLKPGRHCAYCALRYRCTAVGNALNVTPQQTAPEIKAWAAELGPDELTPLLDEILPKAELVDVLAGSLKARAMAIIEAGGEVPGWTVKRTSGPRQWSDEIAAMAFFTNAGIQLPLKLPSPSEAEKLAKAAGLDKQAISEFTQPGKPRLSLRSTK